MAKKKKKKPYKLTYPVECSKCKISIEKPTWDTKVGAIRPHPIFDKKGNITIVCNKCKPTQHLPEAFVKQFGDTRKNGFPVDKDKKNTTLKNAHGFRKVSYKDGKKVVKYVRKK